MLALLSQAAAVKKNKPQLAEKRREQDLRVAFSFWLWAARHQKSLVAESGTFAH